MGIIARPFTHDELMAALQEISDNYPASPLPHLAMAIAFGLGHRDLAALKQHEAVARNRLTRIRPSRGDAETGFYAGVVRRAADRSAARRAAA